MFRPAEGIKIASKNVGGKCMRRSDGKLCFSEKERDKVWKDYMEKIMNEKHDLVHNVDHHGIIMRCSRRSSRLCMQR